MKTLNIIAILGLLTGTSAYASLCENTAISQYCDPRVVTMEACLNQVRLNLQAGGCTHPEFIFLNTTIQQADVLCEINECATIQNTFTVRRGVVSGGGGQGCGNG